MKTSVVIMSHNNLAATHKCISSVMSLLGKDREMVVLDDSSTDGSGDYIKALNGISPNIKGVVFDEKVGPCRGRNEGVRLTSGENILFLDNDTYSSSDFISVLEKKMEALEADIVGMCSVVTFDLDSYFHVHQNDLAQAMETMSVTGYCLMMKRSVFDEVDGYDVEYDIMDEDIDICFKALKKNKRIFVLDGIPLTHSEHGSGFATSEKFESRILRNHKILEMKHAEFLSSSNLSRFQAALFENMSKSKYDLRLTNVIGKYHFYDSFQSDLSGAEKKIS